MKLYKLAHCRTGDKGNTLTLSVIAYDQQDLPLLIDKLTEDIVKKHLEGIVLGKIDRYVLESIGAIQFICHEALDTGVTTSLTMDTHGKSLSYSLLELDI